MYADVIPLLRLPNELGAFTYRVPDVMTNIVYRGTFVRIPFRGKKNWGIVFRLSNTPGTTPLSRIRDILAVREDAALTEQELVLIEQTAATFRHSVATTARMFLPQVPVREIAHQSILSHLKRLRINQVSEWARRTLERNGDTIIIPHSHAQRLDAIRDLAACVVRAGKSALIITPHRSWFARIQETLAPVVPTTTFDLALATGAIWRAFVRTRHAPVAIIGTRAAAILAPPNLGAIIIDEAHDDDLKSWDASPRYDARTLTAATARMLRIPRILLSPAPRVVDWTPEAQRLDLGVPGVSSPSGIIDLRAHWSSGGRGLVTDDLIEALTACLDDRRVAIVLHNRRGIAARIICLDCHFTLTCTACGAPITEHPDGGRCARCVSSHIPITTCPACRSLQLTGRGEGTVALVRDIQRTLPHTRIARIDRDNPSGIPHDTNVIVCSERFTDALAPTFDRPIGLIAIAHAERLVRGDDYRSTERLLQTLCTTAMWARTWNARFLIQTSDPGALVIRIVTERAPLHTFYRAELEERSVLSYPPATRLISYTTSSREAVSEYAEFQSLLKSEFPAILVQIDGPMKTQRLGSAPMNRVIIRLVGNIDDSALAEITQRIPSTWNIDVDPIDLT